MARKEITTPLDLKNLDNHNDNYDELYSLVDETDRRISEDMWEEIKDANTMKMLEPVQTAADLPSEAADKSLITVIDEQRVYGFVNGEWQPFNEIDLDPFEPFKDELSEIVAAYEKQIQNITQEVQSTKDSAIESIESTQSQSESNIKQTEQSAVNSINKAQQEAESQISDSTAALKGKTEELTALFNDSMDKLTNKRDTALAEVDSAKQAAIAAIEDFQNIDTSNWQKFKLTKDDGGAKDLSGVDWADAAQLDDLDAGEYYSTTGSNVPIGASSYNAFVTVTKRSSGGIRRIEFKPYNSNQVFIKRFYETWGEWEPAQGTKVELFKGSASGVDSTISLSVPYDKFEYLFVSFNSTPGRQTKIFEAQISDGIVISVNNVYNDASNAKAYEMAIARTDLTTLTITNEASYTFSGGGSSDSTVVIEKIVGVK
ncbi:hypothetical protein QI212_01985 [Staphylococcus saprophyticus]|nr:hypothetical protein [Staphylococcus saprophyticus]